VRFPVGVINFLEGVFSCICVQGYPNLGNRGLGVRRIRLLSLLFGFFVTGFFYGLLLRILCCFV